jgi:LCP family protein required for cell wall assembly
MSDTMHDFFARQAEPSIAEPSGGPAPDPPRKRRRRLRRILLASALSLVLLIGAVAGAGYLVINHLADGIHRISGIAALTAADQPVMPAATRGSMTVLLTSADNFANGSSQPGSAQTRQLQSGLIALVHLNANHKGGSVVSIPPTAVVSVPGRGQLELYQAMRLIRTVEQLTNVRIDHYSVVNFGGVSHLIDSLGGVSVVVPRSVTSYGVSFRPGVNHLTGANSLAYVRQPAASSIGRVELQQNLVRAMLDRMAQLHMSSSLGTDVSVLTSLDQALSVDSNFSNSALESLVLRLRTLHGSSAVFVTAPTVNGSPTSGGLHPVQLNGQLSDKLWQAIRGDSVAAFAHQHPGTVITIAPF